MSCKSSGQTLRIAVMGQSCELRVPFGARHVCKGMGAAPGLMSRCQSYSVPLPHPVVLCADHASTFCSFVTGRYLRADLTPPKRPPPPKPKPAARRGKATAAAAADPEDDPHPDTVMEEPGATDWDHPSRVIRLKRAALRALCRALTPDADAAYASASPIPPATAEAVQSPAVQDVLVQLLAIEYDEQDSDEYGAKTYLDRAHLRAAAAAGLLRLARRHDSRLSPGCYVALALAMQDPAMEVRRDTGEQVGLT